MRVVLVCPYAWDLPGGVQVHVDELHEVLAARGHEVLVLGPSAGGEVPAWVEVVGRATRIPYRGTVAPVAPVPSVGRLREIITAFEPDLVHVHEPFAPSTSLWATLASPVPVVATFHSYLGRSRIYERAAPVLERARRRLRGSIAVSEAAASFVRRAFPDLTLDVIPNGLDVGRFADAAPIRAPEGRGVAWVHRLDPQKGFRVLMEAWPEVLRAVPDARLLVAGDGPDRGAVGRLSSSARERVDMYGQVPHDRVAGILRAARVAVASATGAESFGYSLVEAMAAGTPVVATDIPGYREVATDEVNALLVPPGDAGALAQALVHVLQDHVLADRLAAAGRERAAEFDWGVVVARIEAAYARALDG